MLKSILMKLENPKRPLLGPNIYSLQFWGVLLPKNNICMKYFYLTTHTIVTLFVVTEIMDVWYIKSDLNNLLNNLKTTILATMSTIKVISFLYWQKRWWNVIDYVTESDINRRKSEDVNKKRIIENYTKYCRIFTYSYWTLMYFTILVLIVTPIFKYIFSSAYRYNVKNGNEEYLQVVSSWMPFDKNAPVAVIPVGIVQGFMATYGGGWISSYDTNALVIMVYFRAELELLRIDSANIFGEEDNPVATEVARERLRECHKKHVELIKYIQLLNSCLSPIMLLYLLVCAIMLCVTAYQITVQTSAMEKFFSIEYLVFGVAQLFFYCWHSNNVLYASYDLTRGPYESFWWKKHVSRSFRKDLFILTAQFNKIVVFTAGPFTDLNMATFINILKGAYSYYALLTNSQK